MAIYHLSIKIISRGKGKSVVAAAAYRSGEKITNEYDGVTHDYTRKSGIVHTEILLPENAPTEYKNCQSGSLRAILWNAVEKVEKNKNAQLAREIELALPKELSEAKNRSIVRAYVKKNFVDKGMCADICIHDKKDGNPHAHIMLTMRPFNEGGTWGAKSKKEYILDDYGEKIRLNSGEFKTRKICANDWNEQTKAEQWRSAWAESVNSALEQNNIDEKIDHRSYERQGINQIPTIHLGVAASQMEKRGIKTDRGNINREIEITNQQLRQLKARINKLNIWLKEETANIAPPALADVIQGILSRNENKAIYNLKNAAAVFHFLQSNKIVDLKDLEDKLSSMIGEQLNISHKLKPINRRLETLNKHFRNANDFKQYRKYELQYEKLYAEYMTIKKSLGFMASRKADKALASANEYHEKYRREITLFNTAEQYLKEVLQKHFDPRKFPPIKKWQSEQAELLSKKTILNNEYKKLKEETREVEQIRREVDTFFRANRPKEKMRDQGLGL